MSGSFSCRPAPLSEYARKVLQPAIDRSNVDWPQVEAWMAEGSGCVWEVNFGQAYVLTVATDAAIEGVLAGGTGAKEWAVPFERAMQALPVHEGKPLQIMGRKGWRRLLPHWKVRDDGMRLD